MTTFKNYTDFDLKKIGIKFGKNTLINNNVIFYNPQNIEIGNNVRIDYNCIIVAGSSFNIKIEDDVHINAGCHFHGNSGNIILEKNVDIADKCVIYTSTYDYNSITPRTNRINGNVLIKKFSIVGVSSILMPNIVIDEHCSIGANSFVKKSTGRYEIWAGNPSKLIKTKII